MKWQIFYKSQYRAKIVPRKKPPQLSNKKGLFLILPRQSVAYINKGSIMTQQQAMKLFEEKKVRTVWDTDTEKWYFSIVDIVAVLTESTDPKQYIKRLRNRDPELQVKWGTICTPVRMRAADGKLRLVDAADTEGIFRIIQSIPSPKAEPFKQWMAQVASQRIDQMQDPELGINQAIARS